MARTVRNSKLDSRSSRAKLPAKKSGYWVPITRGCAIGYRKGTKGGVWLAKIVREGFRKETTLGPADDALDADGIAALDYDQAQAKARAWFAERAREASGEATADPTSYKVGDALDEYLAHYKAGHTRGGGKRANDLAVRINSLIKPTLGSELVARLTAKRIREWLDALASAPIRLRTKSTAEKRNERKVDATDAEAMRRRRATANRTLTTLKSALNHAFHERRAASDEAWRAVRPYREADAPKIRYLNAAEAKRLVNATAPEFRPMVQAALLTGCRYGEIAAFRTADFDEAAGTVTVRAAKGGKPRHVVLTEDGVRLFAAHAAGKPGAALLFAKTDGTAWGRSHQHRPLRLACKVAGVVPPASFHVLRHTYATLLLRAGAPLPVIAANLGHADTRMTERHYAHLVPGYVADTIRAVMPKLGIVEQSNVVSMQKETAP